MRLQLTRHVHLDATVDTYDTPIVGGVTISSWVQSFWPFRGFWLHAELSAWRWELRVYLGE